MTRELLLRRVTRAILLLLAIVLGWQFVRGSLPLVALLPLSWLVLVGIAIVSTGVFRRVAVAASSGTLALALAEVSVIVAVSHRGADGFEVDPSPSDTTVTYYQRDSILGYSLIPGGAARARARDSAGVIYDVTYHVTVDGIRRTPASNDSGPVVAFFGGSFTHGEGVEDDETLPNRFALATGGRFRVLNLALHGYGPHHMLRALETGRFNSLIGPRPAALYYLAVGWHALRSAGRFQWDSLGPMYRQSRDGTPEFIGTFAAHASHQLLLRQRSLLYRLTREPQPPVSTGDVRLLIAIIERADRLAMKRFGTGIQVIYVRDPSYEVMLRRVGWTDQAIIDSLRARGLAVVDGSLPEGPPSDPDRFRYRHDGHPTPAANVLRADLVARAFLRTDSATTRRRP